MSIKLTLRKYFLAAPAAGPCIAVSFVVVKISQRVWITTEAASTWLRTFSLMFIDFIRRELNSTSSASRFIRTLCLMLFNNPQREDIAAKFASSRFIADGFMMLNLSLWVLKPTISASATILAVGLMGFKLL